MYDPEKIISQIDYLSPLAATTHKILAIAQDPNSKISDLVDLIIYDQAMTANILKLCNSAYFGLPRKINSLNQAVAYLGKNQIGELIFMRSISQKLQEEQRGYCLYKGELLKYSISSALIAKSIGIRKGLKDNSLLFTAALLKDIGKIILNRYVSDSFKEIIKTLLNNGCSFLEAEKEIIGINHAELGGLVAEKWNFSQEMILLIRHHHKPDESPDKSLATSIIYMADILCMIMGMGGGADGLAYKLYRDAAYDLSLPESALMDVMFEFMENFKKVEDLITLTAAV